MDVDAVYVGPDPDTDGLWDRFFRSHNLLKAALEKSIYFTIIAGDLDYYALIVTNRGRSRMSQRYWDSFLASLNGPYQLDDTNCEIRFAKQKITLNIHNVLRTTAYKDFVTGADSDRLVRQYYKSGLALTWSVGISTYGDTVDAYNQIARDLDFEGSIERRLGFRLDFLVGSEIRKVDVLSSVVHTWPS